MNIWSSEIKELEQVFKSIKGTHPELEKELEKLISTDDENMLLVYSRRCLEVIITHLCECELKRKRGSEPLQRIIDKLNKEEKVPHNIVVSMQSVNSMSTFGAHPKEFELKQVKPVLSNLETIILWYIKYQDVQKDGSAVQENTNQVTSQKQDKSKKKGVFVIGVVLGCAIIVTLLSLFNVIDLNKKAKTNLIESILVLPFENYTGTDTIDYFVGGMHASLIGDLGKISKLRTVGSTTANKYKNVDLSAKQIASEVNADALLECSLMCLGQDSICLQIRLIESRDEEKQLWVKDFKEDRSKILSLYNNMTKQIANEISIEITPQELKLLADNKLVKKEAYDAYLKGQYYWEKLDSESMQKALDYFELATQLEPDWADPYAGLANAWGLFGFFQLLPQSLTLPNINKYMNKALELNQNSAVAHYVKALHETWTEWDWEQGEQEFLKTLELSPNDALARLYYAHLLMILHRTDEAVHQANIGLALDPLKPIVLSLYAMVMQNEGNYKSCLSNFNKALSIDPNFTIAKNSILFVLYLEGEYEKWIEAWEFKVKSNGHWNEEAIANVVNAFHENGHIAAIEEMFRMNEKYGDEGAFMSNGIKIIRYFHLKDYEKALDYLEKSSELKDLETAYYGTNLYNYDELKENPRYIALLKKMGVPFE